MMMKIFSIDRIAPPKFSGLLVFGGDGRNPTLRFDLEFVILSVELTKAYC